MGLGGSSRSGSKAVWLNLHPAGDTSFAGEGDRQELDLARGGYLL
jgi:hypothetical protein